MSAQPRNSKPPAPAAEEVAAVVGLTHDGEGVVRSGRTDDGEGVVRSGKTVFVPGALPGETIRFRRVRRKRQHDEGELLEVLEPAPSRATPRCAHFGTCGGCALQHLAPEAQLEAKQAELRDNLERVARVAPDRWLPPLCGPVWEYRRRARLGAKFVVKKGKVVVGFRERAAPYVADVERCHVLAAPVGELITPLSELLMGLSIRERLPQIEVAVADNAVALVLRVLEAPTAADLQRLREFAARHRVRFYLQPGGLDSVTELGCGAQGVVAGLEAGTTQAPGASEPLYYRLPRFNVELEFTPTDFIQINGAVNAALVERAVDLLELTPESTVLDLFCGLGNFTLAMARSAGHVVGVEGDAALVERARHNARRNNIANVDFHMADLAKAPAAKDSVPWLRHPFTHVLLDPPRAGAWDMLPAVARLEPRKLLYISCHPGSLARDVGALVHEHGFQLEAAGVLDMFPHTAHVESMALLKPTPRKARAA